MLVVINFQVSADIIEMPDCTASTLREYQKQFDQWIFNKDTSHSYWTYRDGQKFGCCYRSDAFVEWLNSFPLKNSIQKALIKETEIINYRLDLLKLDF